MLGLRLKTRYFPKKFNDIVQKTKRLKVSIRKLFSEFVWVCVCLCVCVHARVNVCMRVCSCCRFALCFLYKQAWSFCKNRKCQTKNKKKYIKHKFDQKLFFKNFLWIFSVFVSIDQQPIRRESCATTAATVTTTTTIRKQLRIVASVQQILPIPKTTNKKTKGQWVLGKSKFEKHSFLFANFDCGSSGIWE